MAASTLLLSVLVSTLKRCSEKKLLLSTPTCEFFHMATSTLLLSVLVSTLQRCSEKKLLLSTPICEFFHMATSTLLLSLLVSTHVTQHYSPSRHVKLTIFIRLHGSM